jgi:putative spermidine/putrescine transport system ATP-binding protein
MDEPLGALDKQLREHMQIELKELHHQLGVTFVYVTHDQGEALTMSDRVAVFNEGVIQQLADVETLYETPSNRFVAGFVGDSTVLTGTLQGAGADAAIQMPGGFLLPGVNVNQAALGARVQACVRPERILLHPSSDYPRPNAIPATVARTIYYGDHQRLMCDLGHGQEQATVKLPLAPAGAPCSHPQPGDQVLLEFPPAATRIYTV